MKFLTVIVWLISSLPLISSNVAHADARQEAHRHYEAGVRAFDELRFADAAAEFERAYAQAPAWQVLYNLGTVYVALGRCVEAAATLERYLQQADDSVGPERPVQVQAEIAKQRAKTGSPGARVDASRTEITAPPQTVPPMAASAAQPESDTDPGSVHRIVGLSLGAAGLAGVAVGVVVAGLGQGKHNDAVELWHHGHPPDQAINATEVAEAHALEDAANRQKTAGFATIGVGAAFVLAGVARIWLAPDAAPAIVSWRVSGWASMAASGVVMQRSW
jgi:tetratricopeptide (TPR) repeat protein